MRLNLFKQPDIQRLQRMELAQSRRELAAAQTKAEDHLFDHYVETQRASVLIARINRLVGEIEK